MKLPDGSEVKRSDLDLCTMMQNLQSQLETTTSSLDKLKPSLLTVGLCASMCIGSTSMQWVCLMRASLRPSRVLCRGSRACWRGFQARVAAIGMQEVSDMATQVDKALARQMTSWQS